MRTRSLTLALLLSLVLPAGALVASTQSAQAAKPAANTLVAPPDAVPGERITFRGSQKFGRVTITLQRKAGKRWVKAAVKRKAARKFVLRAKVPATAAGVQRFRVRATVRGTQKTFGRARVRVVAQRLTFTAPKAPEAGVTTSFAGVLTPVRAARPVHIERHLDGRWTSVRTTGRPAASGSIAGTVQTEGYPAWYRITAAPFNGIPAISTAPVLTTLDRIPTAVAHRSGALLAPEQTLAALDRALASGVPSLEIDVQLTSDGVPIIVHDKTFARTTDVATRFPGRAQDKIASFTAEEVALLDAGSWFGQGFAGERIPTLSDWLARMGTSTHLVLEVKDTEEPGNAAIGTVLGDMLASGPLKQLNDLGKLTVSSFGNPYVPAIRGGGDFLKTFAQAQPSVPVAVLTYGALSEANLADARQWASEVHSMILLTDASQTRLVRASGMTTSVWTAITLADHRGAIATGAERVISDDPRLLAQALNPPRP